MLPTSKCHDRGVRVIINKTALVSGKLGVDARVGVNLCLLIYCLLSDMCQKTKLSPITKLRGNQFFLCDGVNHGGGGAEHRVEGDFILWEEQSRERRQCSCRAKAHPPQEDL